MERWFWVILALAVGVSIAIILTRRPDVNAPQPQPCRHVEPGDLPILQALSDADVDYWTQAMAAHADQRGRCPRCRQHQCEPWREARRNLALAGVIFDPVVHPSA